MPVIVSFDDVVVSVAAFLQFAVVVLLLNSFLQASVAFFVAMSKGTKIVDGILKYKKTSNFSF